MLIAGNETQFYPTPPSLVKKMLEKVDLRYITTILEPSAGTGNILKEIAKREYDDFAPYEIRKAGMMYVEFDVDCFEIDKDLRQILKYNFSNDYKKTFEEDDERKYAFFKNGIHIIGDDFLKFQPLKQYNLIIMNPPFAEGDKHLLKALDIQKDGGKIVCLLNAETIKNQFTETRKELYRKLVEYNADIEFLQGEFTEAERKTDVETALIFVDIPKVEEESEIYNRFKKAENYVEEDVEVTDIEPTDFLKAITSRFKAECKSGIELLRQYKNLKPYITGLSILDDNGNKATINEYLKATRLKYWRLLLTNSKFVGKLTSKLRESYLRQVENLSHYDFDEFNINTLLLELNSKVKNGIEEEIIAMFDRLTEEHTWFPEMEKNKHYYSGWKTNKAHKIDKKVIIPCYGVFDSWDGQPRSYNAYNVLADIERCLNFLDGNMTENVDMEDTLRAYFNDGQTKKIPLKFFNATFYKKGTVHLEFNCPKLIERFNIYAGQYKNWLPPCYGKKEYSNMDSEEKAVIDEFQGEEAYKETLKNSNYYLAPVVNKALMLGGE